MKIPIILNFYIYIINMNKEGNEVNFFIQIHSINNNNIVNPETYKIPGEKEYNYVRIIFG
jgi:hypothetical protein